MENELVRRRRVAWAVQVTQGTSLEPGAYERQLLEEYAQGKRELDEVCALLELAQQGQREL